MKVNQMKLRDGSGRIWEVFISRDGESTTLSSLSCEGEPSPMPSLTIESGGGEDSVRLIVAGQNLPAHIARAGDEWWVHIDGRTIRFDSAEGGSRRRSAAAEGSLTAPMPGTVVEVLVSQGDEVAAGDPLIVMEAMKMEHRLHAPFDGEVVAVHFSPGDKVQRGVVLLDIE